MTGVVRLFGGLVCVLVDAVLQGAAAGSCAVLTSDEATAAAQVWCGVAVWGFPVCFSRLWYFWVLQQAAVRYSEVMRPLLLDTCGAVWLFGGALCALVDCGTSGRHLQQAAVWNSEVIRLLLLDTCGPRHAYISCSAAQ
jgi:hypothetical protein